jgi:hypothetical protein
MWICRVEFKGSFMELRRQSGEHPVARPMAGIGQTFHENHGRVRAQSSRQTIQNEGPVSQVQRSLKFWLWLTVNGQQRVLTGGSFRATKRFAMPRFHKLSSSWPRQIHIPDIGGGKV